MSRSTYWLNMKNCLVFLLPLLLLGLAACGESGSPGGDAAEGKTAAISMSADTQSVPADGDSSVSIQAQLTDSLGQAVVEGTSVTFFTNIGTFRNGEQQYSVKTAGDSGTVVVTLHATEETGVAEVRAESNGIRQKVEVRFLDPDNILSINLSTGSSSIEADGVSQVVVRAEVSDAIGNPVTGKEVTFSTTAGELIETSAITDVTGTAEVMLRSGTKSGPVTLRAESDGFIARTTIEFIPGDVHRILLYALPNEVPPNGEFQIAAILLDVNDNRIDTKRVHLEVRRVLDPDLLDSAELTPDQTEDGVYRYDWTAATAYGTGDLEITARVNNGVSETVIVKVREGSIIVGSISVTAGSSSLEADGNSTTTIRATVLDSNGQPAPGITVNFSTTLGSLSAASRTTNENGVAEIRLRAGTVEGTARVTAEANGWRDQVDVAFVAGFPGSLSVTAIPDSLAPGQSATIIATLRDSSNDPISDEDLHFNISRNVTGGSLSAGTVSTDGSGEATVTYTAGSLEGTDQIRVVSASNSAVRGFTSVRVLESSGLEPGGVDVLIRSSILPADGTSTTEVVATVRTVDNQAVEGATVVFSTTRGTITSPHITNASGQATALITSERYEDPVVEVTAECQGYSASAFMAFTGIRLELESDEETLLVGEETRITGTLLDANDNPIVNQTVDVQIESGDNGSVSLSSGGGYSGAIAINTDANGEFEFWATSDMSGITTVQASARGAEAEQDITFSQYNLVLVVDPTTIRVTETATLTATLYGNGVPLPGETVDFSSTLGTLGPPSSAITDANGEAEVVLTAGAQSGMATIEAVVDDVEGSGTSVRAKVFLTITGGDAAKIVLKSDPGVIRVDPGVSTIRVSAYDADDQPAGGQKIYFQIAKGPGGGEYLGSSVRTTDSFGQTEVRFYAGALTSSEVIIEADTVPDFSSPALAAATLIISGPVANISVSTNLEELEQSPTTEGHLDLGVSAIATDINGNPVADGTNVYFGVKSIAFDEDRDNDGEIDWWYYVGSEKVECENCLPIGPDPWTTPPCDSPCDDISTLGVVWFTDDVNQDSTMYSLGGPMAKTEDINNNGILDTGEDINGNGVIDPIQGVSIVGPVPTVNGIAVTTLSYPMSYADNIKVRITAEAGGVSNFYEQTLLCTETMVSETGTCGIGY